jgi:hypothetical protein
MIDPKLNSLHLLTVKEASSRQVARVETQKIADFIHHWLYGMEPTPQLRAPLERLAREDDRVTFG